MHTRTLKFHHHICMRFGSISDSDLIVGMRSICACSHSQLHTPLYALINSLVIFRFANVLAFWGGGPLFVNLLGGFFLARLNHTLFIDWHKWANDGNGHSNKPQLIVKKMRLNRNGFVQRENSLAADQLVETYTHTHPHASMQNCNRKQIAHDCLACYFADWLGVWKSLTKSWEWCCCCWCFFFLSK